MTETNPNRQVLLDRRVDYRKSVDNVDRALIALLAERFRLTEKIGETKAATDSPPADLEREQTRR